MEIGEPYYNTPTPSLEIAAVPHLSISPPFVLQNQKYEEHRHQLIVQRSNNRMTWSVASLAISLATYAGIISSGMPANAAIAPVIIILGLGFLVARISLSQLNKEQENKLLVSEDQMTVLKRMLDATLEALQECDFAPSSVSSEQIELTESSKNNYRVQMQNLDSLAAKNIARSLEEVMMPVISQPYVIPKYEYSAGDIEPDVYFKHYLEGKLTPYISSYHPVPALLARSAKGRDAFERAWNAHVSPGSVTALESNPEDLNKYFGIGPSVAQRMLWK